MCTVTYNVSAVLCLMVDIETANTVKTLLFHGYDDIGPCNIVILVVHIYTPLVHRGTAIYTVVSKTMSDYVYIRYLDS